MSSPLSRSYAGDIKVRNRPADLPGSDPGELLTITLHRNDGVTPYPVLWIWSGRWEVLARPSWWSRAKAAIKQLPQSWKQGGDR